MVGVIVQACTQNKDYVFAGRFVTGLGVGSLSMIVPLYNAELVSCLISRDLERWYVLIFAGTSRDQRVPGGRAAACHHVRHHGQLLGEYQP